MKTTCEPIPLAGCVIFDDIGQTLLLHRNDGHLEQWEVPGGKIKNDEKPEMAACRELYEEMGVSVQILGSMGAVAFEQEGMEFTYEWFQARIQSGSPSVQEAQNHDDLGYFDLRQYGVGRYGLSPAALLLARAFQNNELQVY